MDAGLAQEIVEAEAEIAKLERLPYKPETEEHLCYLQRRLAGLVKTAEYQDTLEHARQIVEAL